MICFGNWTFLNEIMQYFEKFMTLCLIKMTIFVNLHWMIAYAFQNKWTNHSETPCTRKCLHIFILFVSLQPTHSDCVTSWDACLCLTRSIHRYQSVGCKMSEEKCASTMYVWRTNIFFRIGYMQLFRRYLN